MDEDVTEHAKALITLVRDLTKSRGNSATVLYIADVYKGANLKKIRDAGTNSEFSLLTSSLIF